MQVPFKLPFLHHPKDVPSLVGWLVGIGTLALTVYWWFDSLFPKRELSMEAMTAKIVATLVTVAISLYLMHINYD
jgi:hypothetical protein